MLNLGEIWAVVRTHLTFLLTVILAGRAAQLAVFCSSRVTDGLTALWLRRHRGPYGTPHRIPGTL